MKRCYRCGQFMPKHGPIMAWDDFWTRPWVGLYESNTGFLVDRKPVHYSEYRGVVYLPGRPSWSVGS